MKPWLLRLLLAAGAYAITLAIASLLLDRFTIDNALWFIIAVAIFTAATVLLTPIIHNVVNERWQHGATWIAGLITTWLALLLADLLGGSGLQIEGIGTWLLGIVIVWAGTIAYDVVEERVVTAAEGGLKKLDGPGGSA